MIQEHLIALFFLQNSLVVHYYSVIFLFIVGGTYLDPKTVLGSVKSSPWIFFIFHTSGGEVDKKYVFCILCLDDSKYEKMEKID